VTLQPDDLQPIAVRDRCAVGMRENELLGAQGLRVLATARKDFDAQRSIRAPTCSRSATAHSARAHRNVDTSRSDARLFDRECAFGRDPVRMSPATTRPRAAAYRGEARHQGSERITCAEFGAMSVRRAARGYRHIGVIARVTAEHKVLLVDTLKTKGHIVAMTVRRGERRPALKRADSALRWDHRHRGLEEAAAMILTDDNLRQDREGRRDRTRPVQI